MYASVVIMLYAIVKSIRLDLSLVQLFYSYMNFYRAMLCIRGTRHGPVSVSVCLSVSVSVCHKPVFY